MAELVDVVLDILRLDDPLEDLWSGFTSPRTTASPRPQLASMTTMERSPFAGFNVNMTPATRATTMLWMPMLISACSCGKPIRIR